MRRVPWGGVGWGGPWTKPRRRPKRCEFIARETPQNGDSAGATERSGNINGLLTLDRASSACIVIRTSPATRVPAPGRASAATSSCPPPLPRHDSPFRRRRRRADEAGDGDEGWGQGYGGRVALRRGGGGRTAEKPMCCMRRRRASLSKRMFMNCHSLAASASAAVAIFSSQKALSVPCQTTPPTHALRRAGCSPRPPSRTGRRCPGRNRSRAGQHHAGSRATLCARRAGARRRERGGEARLGCGEGADG